jgi:hypothetical protein
LDGRVTNLLSKAIETAGYEITRLGGNGTVSIPKARINDETSRGAGTWKYEGSHIPAMTKNQALIKPDRQQEFLTACCWYDQARAVRICSSPKCIYPAAQ